ncbi:inorganic phosphate transporter [bacterium]|nr:inorganic phosphate transporter [bacterium]
MVEIHWLLIAVIVIALAFDFVNGFHDAANAIATAISTRALSTYTAVTLAVVLNFLGAFMFTGVAKTITSGLVRIDSSGHEGQIFIMIALLGAILWNIITWYFGLPSSSSHALIGGMVGVALAKIGFDGVIWSGVINRVVIPGLISPALGLVIGFTLMVIVYWLLRKATPSVNRKFQIGQIFSCSFLAFAQGTNDAQKVMGIITMALIAEGLRQPEDDIHWLVKTGCALAIAAGTSAGGWRIIKTMGSKVVRLQPANGFVAEISSATVLLSTAALGMPVSTTHVVTGAIMGAGAAKRISAVRWGVGRSIAMAWIFTLPAAALMSAAIYFILHLINIA